MGPHLKEGGAAFWADLSEHQASEDSRWSYRRRGPEPLRDLEKAGLLLTEGEDSSDWGGAYVDRGVGRLPTSRRASAVG